MLDTVSSVVIKFLENFCDISGHGGVAGLYLVVPLQREAKVEISATVLGDCVESG